MFRIRRRSTRLWALLASILVAAIASPVLGQDAVSQLFITGSDSSSAPTIELHIYAIDSQGNLVDFSGVPLVVRHDGVEVSDVTSGEPFEGGTFTVFLVDIPQGVADDIPTIQESIQRFASDPTMKEQIDSVAIYSVDELAAVQVLGPQEFHNSVANAFAAPLTPTSGSTALIDSMVGLLDSIETLKPRPDMVAQLVVISDGTDVVSTQFLRQDVPKRAAELGVPIHTIWLDNSNIGGAEKQNGQEYLAQVAAGSLGTSTTLTTADELSALWQRIASFRSQTSLLYTVDDLVGGDYSVEVSLANNPNVRAETTVTVPPGAPSIVINLPPDSRELTLPNLDQPVELSFGTTVSWLDGVEREITRAQLLVNGAVVQDIDTGSLERFDAEINNLVFGSNRVQVAVVDDQGSRATSPAVELTIAEGETQLPEEVEPRSLMDRIGQQVGRFVPLIGGCLLVTLVLVLMIGLTMAARRSSLIRRLGLTRFLRRAPIVGGYVGEAYQAQRQVDRAGQVRREAGRYSSDVRGMAQSQKGAARPVNFLEVLQSLTDMPSRIDLDQVEVRLGRSSNQADIVFKSDSTVSRIHATLAQEGSDYRIFDEQSTSGTFVNEQRVPDYGLQLVDGDEIRLGAVRLRFRQP